MSNHAFKIGAACFLGGLNLSRFLCRLSLALFLLVVLSLLSLLASILLL